MMNDIYFGEWKGSDEAVRKMIEDEFNRGGESVLVARPPFVAWFMCICWLPIMLVPFIGIMTYFLVEDLPSSERLMTAGIMFVFGTLFALPGVYGWRNIFNKKARFLLFGNQALVEKRGGKLVILPWKKIESTDIELGGKALPRLKIKMKDGSEHVIKGQRSLNPGKTSISPITYRYHLWGSFGKLYFKKSLAEIQKVIKSKIR